MRNVIAISSCTGMAVAPEVVDLGRAPFAATHARMLRVAESVRKRELPGMVMLVEHDPVYTAGRGMRDETLPDDAVPIERGGKLTYHGPGQLVVYPIVTLPKRDVRAWLRGLEAFGVAVCRDFDLEGVASVDGTGVFVENHKVMSIGVAVQHWINLHGISINVDMDLSPFHRIRPCGLDPLVMSDLSRIAGRKITMQQAAEAARRHLPALLSLSEPEGHRRT